MHLATILGALGGFLASQMPVVWKIVQDWLDFSRHNNDDQEHAEHEEIKSKLGAIDEKLERQANSLERLSLQDTDTSPISEWLKSSVRPLLTYAFFVLFATVILVSLYHGLVVEHMPVSVVLPLVWNDDTDTLFAAVISFWFGSRAEAQAAMRNQKNTGSKGTGLNGQQIVGE